MNKLLGPILRVAFNTFVGPSLRRAKFRAVIYYLEAVRSARKAVILFGMLVFCLVIMAGGAILAPLALCLFMPWQSETKAIVACSFAAIYVLVPLVVSFALMSEKRWMRLTKAGELMNAVLDK